MKNLPLAAVRDGRRSGWPPLWMAAVLLSLTCRAYAAGTVSAEFLRFAVGRAAGMSEASGSIAKDSTALYWNPAGLAALDRPDVYFSHTSLPLTLRHDFLSAAVPLRGAGLGGVIGYSAQALTQSAIDKLDNLGNPAGTYNATDMAHTLGWAGQWAGVRMGLAVRYVRQSIDSTVGSAMAGNAGIQRDFGDHWSAGASFSNFGSDLKLGSEAAPLPQTERAGVGLRLFDGDLLLAGDLSNVRSRGLRGHTGLEYRLYPPRGGNSHLFQTGGITTRAGYTIGKKSDDAYSGAAWGLSVDIRSFRADFSYQPFGDLGNALQFGLGYRF